MVIVSDIERERRYADAASSATVFSHNQNAFLEQRHECNDMMVSGIR